MRVLLLEDSREVQGMWRLVLNLNGSTTVSAYRVEQAEAEFRSDPEGFGAIVVDGCLPDGSSVAFVEEVRQSGFSGPIICASDDEDLRERLMQAGCTHRIEKHAAVELLEILGL